MPTKEELETEVTQLRQDVAELAAENLRLLEHNRRIVGGTEEAVPVAPARPSYGLSEGERAELELRGVTTSPWTGETLNAKTENIECASEEAAARAERAADRAAERGE